MNNEELQKFEERCREFGLKLTPQRIAIYRAFVSSEDHPSALQILERIKEHFPTISLDTISRTLQTFVEMGLGTVVEGTGEPRRFDPNVSRHHHFMCFRCGKVFDFSYPPYDSLEIPAELENKVEVKALRVVIYGLCEECRRADR